MSEKNDAQQFLEKCWKTTHTWKPVDSSADGKWSKFICSVCGFEAQAFVEGYSTSYIRVKNCYGITVDLIRPNRENIEVKETHKSCTDCLIKDIIL